ARVFGHLIGVRAGILRDRYAGRELADWNVIDAGTQELDEARVPDEGEFVRLKLLAGVLRQYDVGGPQAFMAARLIQIREIADVCNSADDLGNDGSIQILRSERHG